MKLLMLREESPGLEIHTSSLIRKVAKYFINRKEIVETYNIPTRQNFKNRLLSHHQMAWLSLPVFRLLMLNIPATRGCCLRGDSSNSQMPECGPNALPKIGHSFSISSLYLNNLAS